MNTLKSKVTLVNICLIIAIAIIGIISVYNLYNLSNSIDRLLTNNYKSINASNAMIEAIENQNASEFDYISIKKQDGLDSFYKNSDSFHKYFNIEQGNITEPGEKKIVENIENNYLDYLKLFSEVQEIRNSKGLPASVSYYNEHILPSYRSIVSELKDLSSLNEKAMFKNKNSVLHKSHYYMYLILIISSICVILGLLLSTFFINRFLHPVYELTETIKSIKEGHLEKKAIVAANSEIGILAEEFNKMTERLSEYDQSTAGKLLTEKNKFSAIVKSLADPLIVLNTEKEIVLMNDACQDFFNLKEEDVLNKSFLEVIKNADLHSQISNIFLTNTENVSKIAYFHSDNKDYYFNVIVTLIKDNTSSINGIIVLFQNVTHLKQLEKVKAEFISTISHEFKTPLTSIMMGTSLIEDENIGMLNDQQQQIIATIKEDGERLSELVTNLLQLSRIEWSKSLFSMRTCSILGIIEQAVKGFYDIATNKDVAIYLDIDEKSPKIYADPEKITWVINNLISNSLKYTNAGDEILITASAKHGKMIITVKDTGVGIPEQYLEKIFDRFVQVKGYDFEVRGTGLGLTIAKEIVQVHGGEIWCESQMDVGSSFTFTLPLNEKEII